MKNIFFDLLMRYNSIHLVGVVSMNELTRFEWNNPIQCNRTAQVRFLSLRQHRLFFFSYFIEAHSETDHSSVHIHITYMHKHRGSIVRTHVRTRTYNDMIRRGIHVTEPFTMQITYIPHATYLSIHMFKIHPALWVCVQCVSSFQAVFSFFIYLFTFVWNNVNFRHFSKQTQSKPKLRMNIENAATESIFTNHLHIRHRLFCHYRFNGRSLAREYNSALEPGRYVVPI